MDDEELKAALLAHRRSGSPMKDAIGRGKLTNSARFAQFRQDPVFRAELDAIDASFGRAGGQFVFDAAMKERILQAVRNGWKPSSGSPPSADLPGWSTIRKMGMRDVEFGEALEEARASSRKPSKQATEARRCVSEDQKREILRRLADGKSLRALGAGVPSATRINVHRRSDPTFDARVKALLAQANSNRGRRFAPTPELLDGVIDALRDGRPLSDLGDGFPKFGTVSKWRRDDPVFGAKVAAALVARSASSGGAMNASPGQPAAEFESQKSRDARQRVAETKEAFLERLRDGETIKASMIAVGGQTVIRNYLKADREFEQRYKEAVADRRMSNGSLTRFGWTDQRREEVISALRSGGTLERLGTNMPTIEMVNSRRALDRDLDAAVRQAFLERRKLQSAQRKPKAKRPAPMPITFHLNRTNDIYAAANRAVSRSLPPFARDDIISEIVLSVLSGDTAPHEIAVKARQFASAYNRMTEGKATTSLDEQRGTSAGVGLYDLIAA